MWGIDKRWKAGIMKIRGGAAGRREPPHDITVVTVKRVRLGRLLLFYLENQRNDADDQNAELEQVGISHHDITPLLCSGGGKEKCGLLPKEGPPAYRVLAAPAHIRCARDIIAYCVGIGKTWGRILPSRASPVPPSPIPFVPLGHFPLTRGIGL